MKTTLDLVFKSDLDKPIKLQIPENDSALTKQVVKESMNQLLKLDILKSTVGSINKVYAAYIVSKNTQILFENK
ncbi:DUF2922 domain-containing protein [Staphylococcus warneri]|uniref:DUF2922 domain-containing protein n=1 Tax=Staphylococcus warneri TaxID=1292 RepID=UPI0011A9EBDE|nr:DUF2922 domain-containing protein [Staphylococcus warneri]WNF18469.1 DUF2922 domain-containing protein [Staphylococcus warneri]